MILHLAIVSVFGRKFHVYGPDFLGQLYPDCYRGFVTYANSARVFANRKINLCLHAFFLTVSTINSISVSDYPNSWGQRFARTVKLSIQPCLYPTLITFSPRSY